MRCGTFSRCPACQRLNIYGARCACGHRTDLSAVCDGCMGDDCAGCEIWTCGHACNEPTTDSTGKKG